MQTEVPTLPVVRSNASKDHPRKQSDDTRNLCPENKNSLPCRSAPQLPSNKKYMQSSLGGPYKSTTKLHALQNKKKAGSTSTIGQRVNSAKMLRIKQLQNQLADAHYHLNELSNENRLLKALQKRQDSALRRYEGSNAELPKIISSHHEELRVLQTKYKRLKNLHKETCELLKEKENELYSLQSQNRHLLQLSKDRNLGEREKLQVQVSDLNHRIQQQQDIIQSLQRKLALESKSLKQQLQLEVTKHRETQKHLQEVMKKMKTLEKLLDSREKRIYFNDQPQNFNAGKNVGSQSATNVRRVSISLRSDKIQKTTDKVESDEQRDSLPMLHSLNLNDVDKNRDTSNVTNANEGLNAKTETMANLQRVRKFRLQRPENSRSNSRFNDWKQKKLGENELKTMLDKDENEVSSPNKSENSEYMENYQIQLRQYDEDIEKLEQCVDTSQTRSAYKLPKEIKEQYGYISSGAESEEEEDRGPSKQNYDIEGHIQKSQELYTRLINSTEDAVDEQQSTKPFLLREKAADIEKLVTEDFERKFHMHESELETQKSYTAKYRNDVELTSETKQEMNNLKFSVNHKDESPLSSDSKNQPQNTSNPASEEKFLKFLNQINVKFEERKTLKNTDDLSLDVGQTEAESKEGEQDKRQNFDSKTVETFVEELHEHSRNELISQDVSQPKDDVLIAKSASNYYQEHSEYVLDNSQQDVQLYSKESTQDSFEALEKSILDNAENEQVNNIQSLPTKPDPNFTTDSEIEPMSHRQTGTKVSYNKEKLLATMKAIDDNENIEFLEDQGLQRQNIISRTQITENLFRGLPAYSQRKRDVIKNIFTNDNIENKARSTCSKIH